MGLRELLIAGTITTHTDQFTIEYSPSSVDTCYDELKEIKIEITELEQAIEDTIMLKKNYDIKAIGEQDITNNRLLKRFKKIFEEEYTGDYKIKKPEVRSMFEDLTGKKFPKDLKIKYSENKGYNHIKGILYLPNKHRNKEISQLETLYYLGAMAFYTEGMKLNEGNDLLLYTAGNLFAWAYVSNGNNKLKTQFEQDKENAIYFCNNNLGHKGWLLADALVSVSDNNPTKAYNHLLTGNFDTNEVFRRAEETGINYCDHHSKSAFLLATIVSK